MLTDEDFDQIASDWSMNIPAPLLASRPYILQVANAVLGALGETAEADAAVREGISQTLVDQFSFDATFPARLKEILKMQIVSELHNFREEARQAIDAVPLPPPPPPGLPPAARPPFQMTAAVEQARGALRALRTDPATAAGRRMLAAATALSGAFNWVASGPYDANTAVQERHMGHIFYPMDHENEFARWINKGGREPGREARMNCWESVLFIAYRAGLIPSVQRLRIYHAEATARSRSVGEGNDQPWQPYYETLARHLGAGGAIPAQLQDGSTQFLAGSPLQPKPGELLYWGPRGLSHVALYIGKTWDAVTRAWNHQAWSLHDGQGLHRANLGTLLGHFGRDLKFRPPPWA